MNNKRLMKARLKYGWRTYKPEELKLSKPRKTK